MASKLGNIILSRSFHTTVNNYGKRNFRKFNLYEKRGTVQFKQRYFGKDKTTLNRTKVKDVQIEHAYDRGIRTTGYTNEKGRLVEVPEMIPEIIVPDLEGFELKPYVSYRVKDLDQTEFTPQDLFYAVYSKKIANDFKSGLLNEDGNSKEPSDNESLSSEEAKNRALRTGSDIFQHTPKW